VGLVADYSYALNVLHRRRFERIPRLLVYPTYPAQIYRTSTSPSSRLKLMRIIHIGPDNRQSSCSSSSNVPSSLCTHFTTAAARHEPGAPLPHLLKTLTLPRKPLKDPLATHDSIYPPYCRQRRRVGECDERASSSCSHLTVHFSAPAKLATLNRPVLWRKLYLRVSLSSCFCQDSLLMRRAFLAHGIRLSLADSYT